MARETCADATRHARLRGRAARGPRGEPKWPELTRMLGRGHASPHGCLRGHHVVSGKAGIWRAHGLVGPGEIIGAETQMRTAPLPFIRAKLFLFLHVGLSPHEFYFLHATWRHRGRRMRQWGVDPVDPSPRDHRS